MTRRSINIQMMGIVALVPFLLFGWDASHGHVFAIGDGLIEALPAFYARCSLWDPNALMGYALYADPNQAMFYPLRLISVVPGGFNIYVIASFAISAGAIFVYVYDLTAVRSAAATSALSFAFGGFCISHFGHQMILHPTAWTLVALASLGRFRESRRQYWLVVLAIALAISLSAGQPQVVLFGLVVMCAHALWTEIPRAWMRRSAGGLLSVVVAMSLGTLLGAVFVLPALGLAAQTTRSALAYVNFVEFSLPFDQLALRMAFPYISGGAHGSVLGNVLAGAPAGTFTEATPFVAAGTLVLAFAGIVARPRSLAIFWTGIAVGAIALIVGDQLPFAPWTFTLWPFDLFRIPGRHAYELTLALSILAGFGVAALTRPARRFAIAAGIIATTALYAVAADEAAIQSADLLREPLTLWFLGAAVAQAFVLAISARAGGLAGARAAAATAIAGTLMFAGLGYWRDSPSSAVLATPGYVRALRSLPLRSGQRVYAYSTDEASSLRPNLPSLWGLPNVAFYSPLQNRNVRTFLHVSPSGELLDIDSASTDLAAVRYIALPAQPLLVLGEGEPFGVADLDVFLSPESASSASFGTPTPVHADRVAIVSAMGKSLDTPQGATVATVVVALTNGSVRTFPLRAGVDTAESAYMRPDVKPRMKHRMARVYAQPGASTLYESVHALAKPADVASITIRRAPSTAALNVVKIALIDTPLHRAYPYTQESMLFASAHHFRRLKDVDGVSIFENLRAKPSAWLEAPTGSRDSLHAGPIEGQRQSADAVCSRPCSLVRSEANSPDWQAAVDGRPIAIEAAYGALQRVPVPAGEHHIDFFYRPHALIRGAIVSSGAALALLLWLVTFVVAGQRARRQSPCTTAT